MSTSAAPKLANPGWEHRRERGSLLALRFMAWVAVTLGRPVARLLLYPITLYFLLLAAPARRNSARYLRRVLGRPPTWRERFGHFHCFASTVLDRVYFVREQTDNFEINLRGDAASEDTLARGRGGFMLGAHLGSFECLHSIGKSFPGVRVTMVMYPDNARKFHGILKALAPRFELDVIGIGHAGSTLAIRDAIEAGRLVGLLGDRYLSADAARSPGVEIAFLGQPALFSEGPLRLAMLLRQRVIFMVGLYLGGARYDVRIEALVDFRDPPADRGAREQLIRQALHEYVRRLESLCREAPNNWFNFHDFWREDHAA